MSKLHKIWSRFLTRRVSRITKHETWLAAKWFIRWGFINNGLSSFVSIIRYFCRLQSLPWKKAILHESIIKVLLNCMCWCPNLITKIIFARIKHVFPRFSELSVSLSFQYQDMKCVDKNIFAAKIFSYRLIRI